MNVELKRRTTAFSLPAPASANDNAERERETTSRRRAVIYKPAKSAMTSGRAGTKRWLLEFEPQSPPLVDPLMGWTGSVDPMAHLRLAFPSREAAVAYAERQGLAYEVRDPSKPVKTCPSVDQGLDRPMALRPIEVLPDQYIMQMAETGLTDFAVNFAA